MAGAVIVEYEDEDEEELEREGDEMDDDQLLEVGQIQGKETYKDVKLGKGLT